jgi:hypothetical protein
MLLHFNQCFVIIKDFEQHKLFDIQNLTPLYI